MDTVSLKYGDVVELRIESTGFEGKSVARLDGFVIFVEGAVAGDVVTAKILKKKKKHAEAKVVEVLTPSGQRVQERCTYFGTCGGCKWQHVRYDAQLQFKQQHVADAVQRIAGITTAEFFPIVGAREEYFYRNKLEFSFSDKEWIIDTESGVDAPQKQFALGFHVPQRWDKVLDVHECFLQSELSNDILNAVRDFGVKHGLSSYAPSTESGYFRNLVLREGKNTGDLMVNVVTFEDDPAVMTALTEELVRQFPAITTIVNNVTQRKSQVAVGEYEKVYFGEGVIHDKIGNKLFQISANSFFQTNTRQAEILYRIAVEFAGLTGHEMVYDLYCGAGTIALSIAERAKKVIGVELVESSIMNARMNAQLNLVENCEFLCGDLKDVLTTDHAWRADHPSPDVVIVDPPRSGMHPDAVQELGIMRVPRIVYVSCNPATFARDVKMLVAHGYVLEKVQPVDMFPHTYHIECVGQLSYRATADQEAT